MRTNASMPDLEGLQIPPPFNTSKEFEDFTIHLFNELYKTHNFQRRSRGGQAQDNHDVYSSKHGIVIECKLKYIYSRDQKEIQKELVKEITEYFNSVYKDHGINTLREFYLLSTYHDDRILQDVAKALSKKRVLVCYWGWSKIIEILNNNCPKTKEKYLPWFNAATRDFFQSTHAGFKPNSKKNNKPSAINLLREFKEMFFPLQTFKPHSFQNLFPFNNTDKSVFSDRFFFEVKNEKVKKFLQNISKNKGNGLRYKGNKGISSKELEDILDLCGNNLLYFIESKNKQESVRLPIIYEEHCQCVRCNFYKLDFKNLSKQLLSNNKKYNNGRIEDQLKNAFINFKVGNYKESYNQLKKLDAKYGQNYSVLRFICHYNIQNVYYQFLSSYHGRDRDKLLEEIQQKYDTHKLIIRCKEKEIRDQLEWIHEDNFIKKNALEADEAIYKISASVKRQYNAMRAVDELLDLLSFTYGAIQSNFLFYDIYDSFETTVEKSLNGIIGAFSVQHLVYENKNIRGFPISKFHFNDFLLDLMIFHCNSDKLKACFLEHKVQELASPKNSVLLKLKNILRTYSEAKTITRRQAKKHNYDFHYKLERIVGNVFLVLSKIKIDPSEFISVPNLLLNFFKREKDIAWYHANSIRYLIFKYDDHTLFTALELENLINLIYTRQYGKHGFLELFSEALQKYYPDYVLKNNILYKYIIKQYTPDKFKDLIALWHVTEPKIKIKISKFLGNDIQNNFDATVYCKLAMNGIIEYDLCLDKFLTQVTGYKNAWNYERVGDNFMPYFPIVNFLISFVFQFNISSDHQQLKELAAANEYFNWLLNLETFDYSKFKLEWIGVYDHWTYFKRFRMVNILKENIELKLKEENDEYLTNLYYSKIIHRKDFKFSD